MLDGKELAKLPRLPAPILTVYLDTNPAKARNQGWPSGARIWLKSRAKEISADLPPEERKAFQEQLKRIDEFLSARTRRERGAVIFAGPRAWRTLSLHVEVEDEMHWGRPSMKQLLWLLDEHQPLGVSVIDHSGVRFYRFWMGECEEHLEDRFDIDTTEWRRKESGVRPGRTDERRSGGSSRDAFQKRVDAQFGKLFKETAKRIGRWATREKLSPVFVVGPGAVVTAVEAELPAAIRDRVKVVQGEYAQLSVAELQKRLEPIVSKWKRAQETEHVAAIIANRNVSKAVLGITKTLAAIQNGEARALVVSRGLRGRLQQCSECGWTDGAADRVCRICGGKRERVSFRETIPELARKFSVPVEVVAGSADRELRQVGGMAAWLQ